MPAQPYKTTSRQRIIFGKTPQVEDAMFDIKWNWKQCVHKFNAKEKVALGFKRVYACK